MEFACLTMLSSEHFVLPWEDNITSLSLSVSLNSFQNKCSTTQESLVALKFVLLKEISGLSKEMNQLSKV